MAAVQEDLRVLVESSQATVRANKRRREVLLQYATMVSDLLIPVGDALITEQVAQTFGDLSLLLLLGSMDADCAAGEEAEEQRSAQQAWVKKVLTPLYHCSVAHAATVLPAALLFFLTDYGEVATGMCKELLRALREKDAKVFCHLVPGRAAVCLHHAQEGQARGGGGGEERGVPVRALSGRVAAAGGAAGRAAELRAAGGAVRDDARGRVMIE